MFSETYDSIKMIQMLIKTHGFTKTHNSINENAWFYKNDKFVNKNVWF